ncbi:MAG: S1/P1 nuclease [Gammaproteobacteria bacterium]|nr:S1/P1 nuclease [Gammaproteobacteria bacterium]
MKKIITLVSFCFFMTSAYAYNANGHKIVAQIAYDNLTPTAQHKVTTLVRVVGRYYSFTQFVDGAPWPDVLIKNNVTAFNTWHYINQPFVPGPCVDCHIPQAQTENVIWAISQSEQVLTTPNSSYRRESSFEKSQFLLFFEHFVGDIHQPLHTVALFSTQFPTGDRGGLLYSIHSPIADNLHIFWDEGGGIFPSNNLNGEQIKVLAASIEKAYPKTSLAEQVNDLNPVDWTEEGKNIAENIVYTVPVNGTPSQVYIDAAKTISKKRVALAGYRMASLLNQFFDN